MRVTKVIREYVEREVGKKFEPAFKTAEEIGNPAVKEVRDYINTVIDDANKRIVEMAKSKGVLSSDGLSDDQIHIVSTQSFSLSRYIRDEASDKERADKLIDLRNKKKAAIEDILLSLELGEATKDELRGLIEKVEV